jgi:anti-sigma B factor antagonist
MTESGNPVSSSLFDASVELRGPTAIVHASGEVDIASAPALAAQIDQAVADNPRELIVDLSQVTMLDSSGLGVLIQLLKELESEGAKTALRLVVSEPHVIKVFSITGLDGVFSIFSSVDEAIGSAT